MGDGAAHGHETRCSRCGASFHCGIGDPGGCWCARLPALPLGALEGGRGCLCPDCLAAATLAQPVRMPAP